MLLNYVIALLISLGLILNATDYNSKSNPEKKELHKKAGIVDDDVIL